MTIFRIALLNLFLTLTVQAGTLRLTGSPQLKATIQDGSIQLNSDFDLKNEGDEEILEVYPVFFRSQWKWASTEQRLPVGKSAHWKLNVQVPIGKFLEPNESRRGIFPVYLWRNYKDINGYPFSAPEILSVELGSVTDSEKGTIKTQGLSMVPLLPQSLTQGQSFKLKFRLKSDAPSEITARMQVFSTREVMTQIQESVLTLKPSEEATVLVRVKNSTGLNDSSYPVFVVAEYEVNGIHAYTHAMQFVRIGPEDRFYFWLLFGAGLGLIAVVVSVLFLRTQKKQKRS